MPISTERLPNNPLNGAELAEYTLALLRDGIGKFLTEDSESARRIGVSVKAVFTMANPAFPRHEVISRVINRSPGPPILGTNYLAMVMSSSFQQAIGREWMFNNTAVYRSVTIDITAKFHLATPPDDGIERVQTLEEAPLVGVEPAWEQRVFAFSRSITVDNPNLVRVHYRMPITTIEVPNPTKEVPVPNFITRSMQYSREDYPPPTEPVEVDLSEQTAKEWNVVARAEQEPTNQKKNRSAR